MTSIAVVVLDTLRKDAFDEHFGWLPGLSFEQAYSTANWTGPVHASLFTGEYGSAVGVSSKSLGLDCDRSVLAEELSAAGYRARLWSANPNVTPTYDFDRGFDEVVGPTQLPYPDRTVLDVASFVADNQHLSRHRRYARAVREIVTGDYDTIPSLRRGFDVFRGVENNNVPDDGAQGVRDRVADLAVADDELLFVNLMEAHTPYDPPEPYREGAEPVEMPFGEAYLGVDDPERVRAGYEGAVRYLSDVYREIFGHLRERFDYVITLSDHGELLGEHGDMWNHVTGVYSEITHVPLIVSGEGPDVGNDPVDARFDEPLDGECHATVSLLDVYATIRRLAGLDAGETGGRSLVPAPTEGSTCLAEYRGPFAESLERARAEGLDLDRFDRDLFALIETGYYGYEDYDGWVERGSTDRASPRADLHELVEREEMAALEPTDTEMSAAVSDRLEKLGYI